MSAYTGKCNMNYQLLSALLKHFKKDDTLNK